MKKENVLAENIRKIRWPKARTVIINLKNVLLIISLSALLTYAVNAMCALVKTRF